MNKLVLDKRIVKDMIISEDSELYFDNIEIANLTINIKDDVKVIINSLCNNISHKIKYILGQNASLIVNKLSVNGNDTIDVLLNGEGALIQYNYGHINSLNSQYNINIYHNNCKSVSHIINHGVCLNNQQLTFVVNGYDAKSCRKALINQDNKIICLQANCASIEPNLYINNNEIEANHSAYIGKFSKEMVFYLMSRGLSFKECYQLLIKAFLIGNMDIDYKIKKVFLQVIKNIRE